MRYPEEYVNLADSELTEADRMYERVRNPPSGVGYNLDALLADAQYHATVGAAYAQLAQVALGLRNETL